MQRIFIILLLAITLVSCERKVDKIIKKQTMNLSESLNSKNLELGSNVFIRIFKESNELEVWLKSGDKYELYKNYPIHYYSGDLGPKLKEGDKQAPEGFPILGSRNSSFTTKSTASQFFLALSDRNYMFN